MTQDGLQSTLFIHELTYSLPRVRRNMTHPEIAAFLNELISMEGINGDVPVNAEALRRWAATPELGFVDAFLAALSIRDSCPVYTKNIKHFRPYGVDAPNPLIATSATWH